MLVFQGLAANGGGGVLLGEGYCEGLIQLRQILVFYILLSSNYDQNNKYVDDICYCQGKISPYSSSFYVRQTF